MIKLLWLMIVKSHQKDISPDILQYYSIRLLQHRIVLIHFLHIPLERPNDTILRIRLWSFAFNILFSSLSKREYLFTCGFKWRVWSTHRDNLWEQRPDNVPKQRVPRLVYLQAKVWTFQVISSANTRAYRWEANRRALRGQVVWFGPRRGIDRLKSHHSTFWSS